MDSSDDLNNLKETGLYWYDGSLPGHTGGSDEWCYVVVKNFSDKRFVTQEIYKLNSRGKLRSRRCDAGEWQDWASPALAETNRLANVSVDNGGIVDGQATINLTRSGLYVVADGNDGYSDLIMVNYYGVTTIVNQFSSRFSASYSSTTDKVLTINAGTSTWFSVYRVSALNG